MKKTQSTRPIWSRAKIVLVAAGAAVGVLAASLLMQWLIYDDWLHRTGPLRIVGTCIATAVTFLFALRWQLAIRERQLEMVRRMEMILQMNDRIRNALQAIECLTYVAQAEATDSVRQSVDVIDSVLREVLADSGHSHEAALLFPISDQKQFSCVLRPISGRTQSGPGISARITKRR